MSKIPKFLPDKRKSAALSKSGVFDCKSQEDPLPSTHNRKDPRTDRKFRNTIHGNLISSIEKNTDNTVHSTTFKMEEKEISASERKVNTMPKEKDQSSLTSLKFTDLDKSTKHITKNDQKNSSNPKHKKSNDLLEKSKKSAGCAGLIWRPKEDKNCNKIIAKKIQRSKTEVDIKSAQSTKSIIEVSDDKKVESSKTEVSKLDELLSPELRTFYDEALDFNMPAKSKKSSGCVGIMWKPKEEKIYHKSPLSELFIKRRSKTESEIKKAIYSEEQKIKSCIEPLKEFNMTKHIKGKISADISTPKVQATTWEKSKDDLKSGSGQSQPNTQTERRENRRRSKTEADIKKAISSEKQVVAKPKNALSRNTNSVKHKKDVPRKNISTPKLPKTMLKITTMESVMPKISTKCGEETKDLKKTQAQQKMKDSQKHTNRRRSKTESEIKEALSSEKILEPSALQKNKSTRKDCLKSDVNQKDILSSKFRKSLVESSGLNVKFPRKTEMPHKGIIFRMKNDLPKRSNLKLKTVPDPMTPDKNISPVGNPAE